jgi:RNA 3'-terminal phosphate cyclase (ATP)
MLEIDGAQGEGGGQVLRTALTLSALTGQAVCIFNVRAGRRNPGLAPQHLAGVLAAASICRGEVDGAELGSQEVTFRPQARPTPGAYTFDVQQVAERGSAGAVTLILQAVLLPLALADGESHLTLHGGTHVNWSPPVDYVRDVLLPTLARMGVEAEIELVRWGWYPKGGGEVRVVIRGGAKLRGVDLSERGMLRRVRGVAAASNLPSHIPQRISNRFNNLLREADLPGGVDAIRAGGPSTGTGAFVMADYQGARAGFSALGERGKPSEQVAGEAFEALLAHHREGSALDPHLPDQLIVAMSLAEGPSSLTTGQITLHLLTNVAVIGRFVERTIQVEGGLGSPGRVSVEG